MTTISDKNFFVKRIFFLNGYGASIVSKTAGSGLETYGGDLGLFEIALLIGDETRFEIDYEIFGDVVGRLDFQEVADMLKKIKELPKRV